ncbi:MAG TPA: hypothetical protein VGP72_31945 [Planctomycetota bacterium]|jgi:hypothetical protein
MPPSGDSENEIFEVVSTNHAPNDDDGEVFEPVKSEPARDRRPNKSPWFWIIAAVVVLALVSRFSGNSSKSMTTKEFCDKFYASSRMSVSELEQNFGAPANKRKIDFDGRAAWYNYKCSDGTVGVQVLNGVALSAQSSN